jgi:hypothetical protein
MNSQKDSDSARAVIEQIWYRARINAYAHREAFQEASQKSHLFFSVEIISALVSILAVILVYVVSGDPTYFIYHKVLSIIFTLLSVLATLVSLYMSVMANYLKLDVKAANHEQLVNRYQYIAQRAREIKWPDLPPEDVIGLLKDLERDFQLLKATGNEPHDRHFDNAHAIARKIRGDKDVQIAQSFEIGLSEEKAQHIGSSANSSLKDAN